MTTMLSTRKLVKQQIISHDTAPEAVALTKFEAQAPPDRARPVSIQYCAKWSLPFSG